MTSEKASKFKQMSLDFIFIDGDHRYEMVKQDLNTWFPKVKLMEFLPTTLFAIAILIEFIDENNGASSKHQPHFSKRSFGGLEN